MGRHPLELLTSSLVHVNSETMLKDTVDMRLFWPEDQDIVEDVSFIVRVAISCINSNPEFRPTMQHVSKLLLSCSPSLPRRNVQTVSD
ncbi:hypothetical protein Sjap_015859 [Stephania japonica]|uniref:non-specific serine/threonine protein kinase n=1 Tax=Stephania japonica TaxID=461633 RepID=A0AAP0ILX7_9MAGN